MTQKRLLQKRYSVRNYLPQEVEKDKLEYILECGRLAPSACNYQPWFFYVIFSDSGRKSIHEAYDREWIKSAPVYIVVCANRSQSWKRESDDKDYYHVDAAIAAEHISFAAEGLGLGTCWVCNFDSVKLSAFLKLSEEIEPVVILPVGYIDTEKSKTFEKRRKLISEITKWI